MNEVIPQLWRDKIRAMVEAAGWRDNYGWDVVPEAVGKIIQTGRPRDDATVHRWLREQGGVFDPESLTFLIEAPEDTYATGVLLNGIVSRGMRWRVVDGLEGACDGS